MTGNNTWHGITTVDWPQFKPSKVELDFKENSSDRYYLQLTNIVHIYDDGGESTEKCWLEEILNSNCSSKCKFASFTDLPTCETVEEVICIRKIGDAGAYPKCTKKKQGLSFNIEKYHYKEYSEQELISIEI